jgi:hypothetical protein
VIGPRGGSEICDWLDLLNQISPNLAKSEMKRLSPLIGLWKDHDELAVRDWSRG